MIRYSTIITIFVITMTLSASARAGTRGRAFRFLVEGAEEIGEQEAKWTLKPLKRQLLKGGEEVIEQGARHGDTIRHAHLGVGEPIIARYGEAGARALDNLSPQSARRLSMMEKRGELAATGQVDKMLGSIERHGDRGLDLLWRHKKSVLLLTLISVALLNSEKITEGTMEAGKAAVSSATEKVGDMGVAIVRGIDWTLVVIIGSLALGLALLFRRRRPVVIRSRKENRGPHD